MVYMTISINLKTMFLSMQEQLPMTTNQAKHMLQKETMLIKTPLCLASARACHVRYPPNGEKPTAPAARFGSGND